MHATRLGLLAAAIIAINPAVAAAQSPARAGLATTLRQLDAGFVCPQFLPSDEARRTEISQFGRALAAKGVSFAQATEIRARFLTRHNCNAPIEVEATAIAEPTPATVAPIAVATAPQ